MRRSMLVVCIESRLKTLSTVESGHNYTFNSTNSALKSQTIFREGYSELTPSGSPEDLLLSLRKTLEIIKYCAYNTTR